VVAADVRGAGAAVGSVGNASGDRVTASPYARKLAAQAGINLAAVTGTGPGGRIVATDVEQAIARGVGGGAAPGLPAEAAAVGPLGGKVSGMGGARAEALLQGKRTIPHYYLTVECEVDELQALTTQVGVWSVMWGGTQHDRPKTARR